VEGRSWIAGQESFRLTEMSTEVMLEHAERIIDELGRMHERLATNQFCRTLRGRHAKWLDKVARRPRRPDPAPAQRTPGKGAGQWVWRTQPDAPYGPDLESEWLEEFSPEEIAVRQVLSGVCDTVERRMTKTKVWVSSGDRAGRGGQGPKEKADANWKCQWCHCSFAESGGRSPGPDGPGMLCSACGSRFRNGHAGPPLQDKDGRFVCDGCNKSFETIRGLGSHRRGCWGGQWKCQWCHVLEQASGGKCPGPAGPKTLCSACGSRFRNGHTSFPTKDADGRLNCPMCDKRFDSMISLGGHRRFCDGGAWRCAWCDCTHDESGGKSPGPGGPPHHPSPPSLPY